MIRQYFSTSSIFAIETIERTYKRNRRELLTASAMGSHVRFAPARKLRQKRLYCIILRVNVDKTPLIDDIGLSESLYLEITHPLSFKNRPTAGGMGHAMPSRRSVRHFVFLRHRLIFFFATGSLITNEQHKHSRVLNITSARTSFRGYKINDCAFPVSLRGADAFFGSFFTRREKNVCFPQASFQFSIFPFNSKDSFAIRVHISHFLFLFFSSLFLVSFYFAFLLYAK